MWFALFFCFRIKWIMVLYDTLPKQIFLISYVIDD